MKDRIRRLLAAVATLAALAIGGTAYANDIAGQTSYFEGLSPTGGQAMFGRPQVVWGSSLRTGALTFDGAGTVSIKLGDLEFPDPLQTLSLLVTDLDGISQRRLGPGVLSVDLTGPATLFFAVFAQSEGKQTPGMYYVTTSFTPVPLPAAAWLLLSGLAGLGIIRRKQRSA